MHTVYTNAAVSDDIRRDRLYQGQLFVYAARESSKRLIQHAQNMIAEAFKDFGDPLLAQYEMPVEEYVAIVAPLKPKFIHHPETKVIIRDLLKEMDCDLDLTYQDVPRLRMVTSDGYLTSGVGYAHHAHRDTWYSAPMTQINWWIPIYPMETESSMAFHPQYWDRAVRNGSEEFNYYEWNAVGRSGAAQHIKTDTRKQPKPLEPLVLEPQVRIVPEPGGLILFSGAQLHSTVPNTSGKTRYSLDFRTTHLGDLRKRSGAPNIDSRCTGTSLRDFLRARDLTAMPEDVVSMYDSGPGAPGEALVYQPVATGAGVRTQ
jgi:hypothetical protein